MEPQPFQPQWTPPQPHQPFQQQPEPQPVPQSYPPTRPEPAPLWSPTPVEPPKAPEPAFDAPRPSGKASHAVEIIWQWVTYGLWQWTLIALSLFFTSVMTYFFVHGSSGSDSLSVYSFAAVLCLLPLAVFADRMYSKQEPREKYGFASVVLVLNAVLVVIALVCSLITWVVSVFWMLLNAHSSSAVTVTLVSSMVIAALGVLLFVRMVRPARLERLTKFFPLVVTGVVAVTAVLTLAGPFRTMLSTRADRLIEDNVTTLETAIQTYASENNKLPASLNDLKFKNSYEDGAKALVSKKLVTYKVESGSPSYYSYSLKYQLCMHFKKAKGSGNASNDNLYNIHSNHGKGEQCYDLSAYGSSPVDDYTTDYNSQDYKDLLNNLPTSTQ